MDRMTEFGSYPSAEAMFAVKDPARTCVCLLVDKEEIGSVGATWVCIPGSLKISVAEVMNCMGAYSELGVRRALGRSCVLSSDVSAAFDPNYPSVMEKNNWRLFL